ncbi:MAG: hypothetical protein WC875_00480 [Candidatus Absconditabacterales bacterium]
MIRLIYPNTGRKLRQLITGLLKSGLAQEVRRMNYIKSYKLVDGKIQKNEEKILRIDHKKEDTEKLQKFLEKNCKEGKIIESLK